MKKLFSALALMAAASFSQAAIISCANDTPVAVGGATVVLNCGASGAPTAGFAITGIRIDTRSVPSDSSFTFPGGVVTYTYAEQSGQFAVAGPTPNATANAGQTLASASDLTLNGGLSPAFAINAFTINVAATLFSGSSPATSIVSVQYETIETLIPTGVPEPSTMALLGSALVGLGLISRRKK